MPGDDAAPGLAAVQGVLSALGSNQRQLQECLNQAAAATRLPFAHLAGGGFGKGPSQSSPSAMLAATTVGLHAAQQQHFDVAAAQQQQQQQQQHANNPLWRLLHGNAWNVAPATPPVEKGAAAAAATAAATEVKRKDASVVCIEYTKGKRRVYRTKAGAASPETEETESASGKAAGAGGHSSATAALEAAAAAAAAAAGLAGPAPGAAGFEIVDDAVRHRQRFSDLLADYLLPQDFPHSVAPQYSDYMTARSVQYFFGGAMSVFTTRSLLASLGVANKHSSEAAAAINWVVKDGAGRLGRFLFARWGRELDCELKQFRLMGDVLMEAGAALELSTVLMPRMFLPLACTANLAKNLAAVAASSTRAPIYRTFAKQNNLADVTAKGESVANLADVVGTAFGIALAKANLPVLPTFVALSIGYLAASRREVDSVVLPYLNRARLSYTTRAFYSTGSVPETLEGNYREPLMPWSDPHNGRVVLGATVEEACAGPQQLHEALVTFAGRQYAITYRPDTRKCYALLKQGASPGSVLAAAMDAHALLWMLDQQVAAAKQRQQAHPPTAAAVAGEQAESSGIASSSGRAASSGGGNSGSFFSRSGAGRRGVSSKASNGSESEAISVGGSSEVGRLHRAALELGGAGSRLEAAGGAAAQEAVRYVAAAGAQLHRQFEEQAEAGGWRIHMTMLNPRETRLAVS